MRMSSSAQPNATVARMISRPTRMHSITLDCPGMCSVRQWIERIDTGSLGKRYLQKTTSSANPGFHAAVHPISSFFVGGKRIIHGNIPAVKVGHARNDPNPEVAHLSRGVEFVVLWNSRILVPGSLSRLKLISLARQSAREASHHLSVVHRPIS